MIKNRSFWQKLIEQAWKTRTVIWLMGVRRIGKTSLCNSIKGIHYFDCELPRTKQLLSDPEAFLESQKGKRIALDEIHTLPNPSQILKIAADHYPDVLIIATGSSTLGASAKFKDTLTGRKKEIWLTPLLLREMKLFGTTNIRHRFLFGGFPAFFSSEKLPESEFQEWIDAYWAKDIQELFSVEKRHSFQKFAELLLVNSGGMFEATKYALQCEVNRATITNYLNILEETFVVHIVRPFSTRKQTEIVLAPKVYGFDTGFICHAQGKSELHDRDLGFLWEHCVLNELNGQLQTRKINYWRDKNGHEIDFVIANRAQNVLTAIECKFSSSMDTIRMADLAKNFEVFRTHYPNGQNFIVSSDIGTPFKRKYKDLIIEFVNPQALITRLKQV